MRFLFAQAPATPALRPGGFNLLPYRQRDARLARRRCAVEWLGAVFVGGVAVLLLAGWQALGSSRLAVQRASVERSLAQLSAPLAEHARLVRETEDRRARTALAGNVSVPLTHLLDLLDLMSMESTDGVVVQELRHRAHETELRGAARDHGASAEWLRQVSEVRGAKGSERGELHRVVATGAQRDVSATDGQVEFTARLRWTDSPGGTKHPSLSANASTTASHNNRGEK